MRECVCVCIKITAGENTHVCGKQMQLEKKGEKKKRKELRNNSNQKKTVIPEALYPSRIKTELYLIKKERMHMLVPSL